MIDPSIYSQAQPQPFNSPFQVLGQLGALQRQRQVLATGQALEQERRQKLADDQKKQAEADRFNAILSSPDFTPESFLETVRTAAPEHYEAAVKSVDAAKKNAADLKKTQADADEANAKVATQSQEYLANQARLIRSHNYSPESFRLAMEIHNEAFPQSKTGPQLLQFVQQNGPASIKTITDGLIKSSDLKNEADTANAVAELPGKQAQSTIQTQVAAGTSGGLTPEQQAQNANRAQQLELERTREAEQRRHNRVTEAAANPLAALTGAGGSAVPQGQAGPSGEDFLKSLPPAVAGEVKAYAEGRRPFPAGFALKSPYFQSMIQMVGQYDPSFDAANYNARNKARTDLTSPSGTGGKTINALNTALQHAGKLSDLIEKLDNTNVPLANAVINPLRSAAGGTAVTNFTAVAPQLAKEIERAWRGTGGSTADVQALIDSIGKNMGIQQQREALSQFVDLAKGKLSTTETQRDNIMGPAGASIPVLFDQNKAVIDKIEQRAGGAKVPAGEAPAKSTRKKNAAGDTVEFDGTRWNLVSGGS